MGSAILRFGFWILVLRDDTWERAVVLFRSFGLRRSARRANGLSGAWSVEREASAAGDEGFSEFWILDFGFWISPSDFGAAGEDSVIGCRDVEMYGELPQGKCFRPRSKR